MHRVQSGKRKELIEYFKLWDAAGRLELVPVTEVPADRRGTLFPVFKDEHTQRIVFNRIP